LDNVISFRYRKKKKNIIANPKFDKYNIALKRKIIMLLKDNDQCSFINPLNLKKDYSFFMKEKKNKDYSWKTKLVPVKGKISTS
jgi:hypothetical protein